MATSPTPIDCFFTTVRNTSGVEMAFGFLGTHGKRLLAGAQFTVPGNLIDRIARNRRKFNALERAVQLGLLVIVKTPAVHLWDAVRDDTKVLTLKNNALGFADPCWGRFSSVGGVVFH
jgi:hypothetical protein